jgi:hypothetical protein
MFSKNLKEQFSKYKDLLNLLLLGFLFFGFPMVEKPLVEFAQIQINNLGIFAPLGYISFGVLSTVVAPVGLGPANVILQRAFGFWPSVLYFWIYETIGISINFLLSAKFGDKIVKFFTGNSNPSKPDPITKLSTYMLNKNYASAFVCMLGFGGEIMGYLAGLSRLNYFRFLSIIVITNFINALLFVGSNLTVGTNNTLYIGISVLNFSITTIPIAIFFRKEIWSYITKNVFPYITKLIRNYKQHRQQSNIFQQQIQDFKNDKIGFEIFSEIFLEKIHGDWRGFEKDLASLAPSLSKNIKQYYTKEEVIKTRYKQLTKAGVTREKSSKLYQLAINKFTTVEQTNIAK